MDIRDDQVAGPSRPKRKCSNANNKRPLTTEELEEEANNVFSDSESEFELSDENERYLEDFSSDVSGNDSMEGK